MRIIEGDFDLDPLAEDVVIDGDLRVTGNIINARGDGEGAISLLVKGNLFARNLIAGGVNLRVEGNAEVEGLILAHDIGAGGCCDVTGSLAVDGTTRARLIINDAGHSMNLRTESPWWSGGSAEGMPLSDHLHADVEIDRERENDGIVKEQPSFEQLLARVRSGLPVLRDPDDPRPRKSYAQWLADCEIDGDVLQYAPREMIDAALCFAAVRSNGHAIARVPRELVTEEMIDAALDNNPYAIESIPEESRTAARCRIAVQCKGRELRYVPVALRTPELCALAIERDTRVYEVLPHIPQEHLTHELCLRAAQRDGLSLSEMPEHFRTFDVCVAALNENWFVLNDIPVAIRDAVVKTVHGEPVEASPEVRALLERPSKWRFFLFYLRHLWRGFRTRPSAPTTPRRD